MYALVFHNMGDPERWREAIADFELALPRYARGIHCIVHDATFPVPQYLREFPFDLIVINSTVLGAVTNHRTLAAARERFRFLEHASAYKVALPQDDYYCSEEIDRLMVDWRIDTVHTICPQHWDVLYPRFLARGGDLQLGYTGYVTPRMRRMATRIKARDDRRNDVVYRAAGRPGFPNKLALVKAGLGESFLREYRREGWALDITTDDSRVITGQAWWAFLADSRITLGSNSGSSSLIRNLGVASRIQDYQREHPDAPPDEVIEGCIPSGDRELHFSMISPRVLEAALVESTQLLVPGPYSGILRAGEHYWPLAEDCSNREEVSGLLRDRKLQAGLAARCREMVEQTAELQIENFITRLEAGVRASSPAPMHAFEEISHRHQTEFGKHTRQHYRRVTARQALAMNERERRRHEAAAYGDSKPRALLKAAYRAIRGER